MTLDEAIKYVEEAAIKYVEEAAIEEERLCKRYDAASGYLRSHNESIRTSDAKKHERHAEELRQFAEWFKGLKQLKEQTTWIPCSERLPEESGFYLVSTTDCITIMEFIGEWISQNLGSCNWYVKAWKPLPNPYKAESEDKE